MMNHRIILLALIVCSFILAASCSDDDLLDSIGGGTAGDTDAEVGTGGDETGAGGDEDLADGDEDVTEAADEDVSICPKIT